MSVEGHRIGSSFARLAGGVAMAALVVQFLLGMFAKLYVHIAPAGRTGGCGGMLGGGMMRALGRAMSGSSALMVHMMLGWLLVLLAVISLIGAVVARRTRATVLAAVGLTGILLAGYGGMQFMMTGRD